MADKEKILKGLEMHEKKRAGVGCLECPYAEAEGGTDDWCIRGLHRDILALLKEQETVVRCKDCKYNSGNCHGLYAQFVTCYKTGSPHRENWYCADGERR